MAEVFIRLREPAEIRDAGGNLIGFFMPAATEEDRAYAEAAKHFDPEELWRRAQSSDKRYTTKEVLEHLKSLENG